MCKKIDKLIINTLSCKTEQDLQGIQEVMSNLDTSMTNLLETLESMKPAYAHALRMLEKTTGSSAGTEQKVRTINI